MRIINGSGSGGNMTPEEKAKLAGIEDNATRDQSDSEIKTAYENNTDTNVFTNAEKTKLANIAGIGEAPTDGKQYARQDATWQEVVGGGGGTTVGDINIVQKDNLGNKCYDLSTDQVLYREDEEILWGLYGVGVAESTETFGIIRDNFQDSLPIEICSGFYMVQLFGGDLQFFTDFANRTDAVNYDITSFIPGGNSIYLFRGAAENKLIWMTGDTYYKIDFNPSAANPTDLINSFTTNVYDFGGEYGKSIAANYITKNGVWAVISTTEMYFVGYDTFDSAVAYDFTGTPHLGTSIYETIITYNNFLFTKGGITNIATSQYIEVEYNDHGQGFTCYHDKETNKDYVGYSNILFRVDADFNIERMYYNDVTPINNDYFVLFYGDENNYLYSINNSYAIDGEVKDGIDIGKQYQMNGYSYNVDSIRTKSQVIVRYNRKMIFNESASPYKRLAFQYSFLTPDEFTIKAELTDGDDKIVQIQGEMLNG